MNILFDAMSVQVQVQQKTEKRLTTWFSSLENLGYQLKISDHQKPLHKQMAGIDVLVSLTRQQAYPSGGGPISNDVCFSFPPEDLAHMQSWVENGHGILAFTNHGNPWGKGPWSPLFEIQLAAVFGIPMSFAAFMPKKKGSPLSSTNGCTPESVLQLRMSPHPKAPKQIMKGVKTIESCNSGGIGPLNWRVQRPGVSPRKGIVLVPLPPNCTDTSGLRFRPNAFAFAVMYRIGFGRVIVIGHSGIVGNAGSCKPAPGQIDAADNKTFLNNCVAYLGKKRNPFPKGIVLKHENRQ